MTAHDEVVNVLTLLEHIEDGNCPECHATLKAVEQARRDHDQQVVNATIKALRAGGWLRETAGIPVGVRRIVRDEAGRIVALVETREIAERVKSLAADAAVVTPPQLAARGRGNGGRAT